LPAIKKRRWSPTYFFFFIFSEPDHSRSKAGGGKGRGSLTIFFDWKPTVNGGVNVAQNAASRRHRENTTPCRQQPCDSPISRAT